MTIKPVIEFRDQVLVFDDDDVKEIKRSRGVQWEGNAEAENSLEIRFKEGTIGAHWVKI